MKMIRLLTLFLSCWLLLVGQWSVADDATWADTLQQKIDSLDLTDMQKSSIAEAFGAADAAYERAIFATRATVRETLTDDQRQKLQDMADEEIQRRLQGDDTVRTQSIAELASDLEVTDEQSSLIRGALSDLGNTLDGIDAQLRDQVKSVLDAEQIAKIKSWF
ncbi:hypothetical protein G8770_19160 [Aestuariicella hydrocarbonica]|uniref:LTXXQ motif family protein n=1 Tax=Pseudomaricurvus hydrocarbonicus TaxID=1470433 RepID=A0A9E5MNT1_9GAMM|nr:hypothetical protein [Aestuariicella hydrocarbonica]NHO67671.1 hypothetical protein [Aestuariicella hydrocarbonica]